MSNKKFGSTNGKGYYIALILCAAAIGISGYMYYRNANQNETQLRNPDETVSATVADGGQDLPVIATKPTPTTPDIRPSQSTSPTEKPAAKPMCPVSGQTVAEYAMDCLSYNQTTRDWRTHNGMDIAAEAGTEVCAAADGTVYTVYEDETMGMTVVIRHEDGYTTKYASLDKEVHVAPGDTVSQGDVIGTVGETALLESAIGPHVHFSVMLGNENVDPAEYLQIA